MNVAAIGVGNGAYSFDRGGAARCNNLGADGASKASTSLSWTSLSRKGSVREKLGTVGAGGGLRLVTAFESSPTSGEGACGGGIMFSAVDSRGTACPFTSRRGAEVGEPFGDSSYRVWPEAHERRKSGEKNWPPGADNGPGDTEIMLPVLARCMLMSVSGGSGAVRGVRHPEDASLSNGEPRLAMVECALKSPADRLGKP